MKLIFKNSSINLINTNYIINEVVDYKLTNKENDGNIIYFNDNVELTANTKIKMEVIGTDITKYGNFMILNDITTNLEFTRNVMEKYYTNGNLMSIPTNASTNFNKTSHFLVKKYIKGLCIVISNIDNIVRDGVFTIRISMLDDDPEYPGLLATE